MTGTNSGDVTPALLTKNEIKYLNGQLTDISKGYEAVLRHGIRAKVKTLQLYELPLLAATGYISTGTNPISANPNVINAGTNGGLGYLSNTQNMRQNEKNGWGEIRTLDHLCVRQVS